MEVASIEKAILYGFCNVIVPPLDQGVIVMDSSQFNVLSVALKPCMNFGFLNINRRVNLLLASGNSGWVVANHLSILLVVTPESPHTEGQNMRSYGWWSHKRIL